MKTSKCVICERKLKPPPTKRWWLEIRYREGICHECILRLASMVLKLMQKEKS